MISLYLYLIAESPWLISSVPANNDSEVHTGRNRVEIIDRGFLQLKFYIPLFSIITVFLAVVVFLYLSYASVIGPQNDGFVGVREDMNSRPGTQVGIGIALALLSRYLLCDMTLSLKKRFGIGYFLSPFPGSLQNDNDVDLTYTVFLATVNSAALLVAPCLCTVFTSAKCLAPSVILPLKYSKAIS